MCKELKEIDFTFSRDDSVWAFEMDLCYDCGIKIKEIIKNAGKNRKQSKKN
jgi:hypothetical protein